MTFTLSTLPLPGHAFRDLFEVFWNSAIPASVKVELQLAGELPWQTLWTQGEFSSTSDLISEEVSFVLGKVVGKVTLTSVSPSPARVSLTTFALLIRMEVQNLQEIHRLQTSHDQLAAMVEAAPLAMYAVTLEGLIKHWNTAAEETLGLSRTAVLDQNMNDPSLEAAFAALRGNFRPGQVLEPQKVEQVQADGSAKMLELNAAPYSVGTDLVGLVGVAREINVTERQLVLAKQQQSLLESVLAFANDSVLITEAEPLDAPGPRILYANEAFTRTTGYTLEEVLGKTPRLLQGPRSDRFALDRIRAALKAWQPIEVELINYRKDGTPFWVELSIAPVANAQGWYTHWISIQRDITERKTSALQQERERNEVLELAARNVPLGTVLARLSASLEREWPDRVVVFVLDEDHHPELHVNRNRHDHSWNRAGVLQTLLQATEHAPFRLTSGDGPEWWVKTESVRSGGGQRRGVLALLSQQGIDPGPGERQRLDGATRLAGLVIDRYDAQRDLERQALHDSLTGLPNRLNFGQQLGRLTEEARHRKTLLAVGIMDLDRFKLINDTLGHSAGDLLLQQIAVRLRDNLRPGDSLARMGGDEFLIAFTGLTHPTQLEALARRLIVSLESPFLLGDEEVFVRPSVGFSLHQEHGQTPELLLQQADAAMYRAKRRGGGFELYASPGDPGGVSTITLESALNRALERQEFVLHYQPQFHVRSGTLVGMEALLRWRHPELGLIPPNDFIPLAEVTGLIVPIGQWVMEEAARQAVEWSAFVPGLVMAVNLSVRQFAQQDLTEQVQEILRHSGLPARQFEIELTESMLMKVQEATDTLKRLKRLGVRIAVDDFGTGYSNLAYLKHFPIDTLKIDQSFIHNLAPSGVVDERDHALLSAVIHLARALKLTVTAEGVEHQSQLTFLNQQGCDLVQGYLLKRPEPADLISQWLEELMTSDTVAGYSSTVCE